MKLRISSADDILCVEKMTTKMQLDYILEIQISTFAVNDNDVVE